MDRSVRRTVLVLAAVVLLLTAGCLGGGGPETQSNMGGNGNGNGNGDAGADAAAESDGYGGVQASQRSIIRTGSVDLEVDDFDDAQQGLLGTVRDYGGFVSGSEVETHQRHNETYKSGQIVVRVPQENFTTVVDQAQTLGDLQSVNVESEDVTEQLVDIEARLSNLRAERDRLRALYQNASDTEAVLDAQEELSDVQEELERLEAERQSLERRVALSTLRVELRERPPEPAPTEGEDETSVVAAFLASVDGVVNSLETLVVAIAYALPYLAVYVPLIGGALYGVVRLRRWRRGPSPPVTPDPAETGDDASPARDDDGDEQTE